MISPELLRRYPFFGRLDDGQLRELAMIAEECHMKKDEIFFREGHFADAIYLLISGGVDLFFTVGEETDPKHHKQFLVDEINVGEPFGISALIDPYLFTSTARASQDGRVIKINGQALRDLCDKDQNMAYALTQQIAKAFAERLRFTRIQLAAARS